ncbi:MAG: lipocalin family protein [Pseudomonadota bacterium]
MAAMISRATFGFLLLAVMAGCSGQTDGVEPVTPFDINRYGGDWYEIMRLDHSFERGLTNVTATYQIRDDGSVSVLNKGFNREACEWDEAEGIARFQGDRSVGSLSVTFFWPFSGAYNVFELDQENYSFAAVAGPSRNYLWILARQPDLPIATRNQLVARARDLGFPADELILVDHSDPFCQPAG